MRALLLLSLVGIALYALLVLTFNVVPNGRVEDTFAGKTQPNHPIDRELRSWGANLPALVNSQQPQPQQNVAHAPTERMSDADQPAASPGNLVPSELDSSKQDHVEWTKVMLAARAHGEASVSSPTIRFYSPGTQLQVVSRQNGWLQLLDPVTQERGWVFEKYLVLIDGPSPTQTALESTTEPSPAKWLHRNHESRAAHLNSRFEQILRSQSQTGGLVDGLDAVTGGVISGCLGSSEAAKSDRRRGRLARRGNRCPNGSGFHQRPAIDASRAPARNE